jgi:hypothetical protein
VAESTNLSATRVSAPEDRNIVWDNVSWEKTPRTVVIGVAGLVPHVGEAIAALLDKIWPDPTSAENLVAASEKRMKEWVRHEIDDRIAKYDRKKLVDLLGGLRTNMEEYKAAAAADDISERKTWLNSCLSTINLVRPMFLNPEDFHGSVPLVQSLGTLHLGLLRERVVFFDQIFGNDSKANKAHFQKDLTDTIGIYQDFLSKKACPNVLKTRADEIKIEPPQPPKRTLPQLVDTGRDVVTPLKQQNIAEQYTQYFINELEMKLRRDVIDTSLAWSLLDPTTNVTNPIPRDRQLWIGPVGISLSDYTENEHGFPVARGYQAARFGPIKQIKLRHGVILDFIWVQGSRTRNDDGSPIGPYVGNDRGGTPELVTIPQGEYIEQVDTYWNYTLMGIEFIYTGPSNGRGRSGIKGWSDRRPTARHQAAYPDHVLTEVALYGHQGGVSEMYFGFSPDPWKY